VTTRRELTVAAVLAAAGGALAVWAATKTWAVVVTPRPAPLPAVRASVTGRDAVPWAAAMAFLSVAGGLALFATRRAGRAILGGVLVLAGALVTAGAVVGARPSTQGFQHAEFSPAWPVLCGAGGLLVLAAGLLAVVRGRRWVQMGPKYDAPGGADRAPGLWEAIDRGEDPTKS
jgi:hypothetical protein